ncbi:MAG: AAA family ATPase, partial [Chloroflexales bacterium]|nr:AAA family ATPase [Chloroflexales bacterium]
MPSSGMTAFLFPQDALAAFGVSGITERWAAVQEHVHPRLAWLAEQVHAAAARQFPRQWSLYEVSYKSQRYVNRGRGVRAPIDDYHVAFDRPPRGAGILVSVSGAEHAVLVGLQLWRARKPHLSQVWREGQPVWQPLVERIESAGQARFADRPRARGDDVSAPAPLWIERYLDSRQASYLWAGFVYPWHSLPTDLEQRLIEDVLALFPLNEALMERAEALEPSGAALLREQQAIYAAQSAIPPIETIIERIRGQGFTISETLLRAYHVALQTRPLVILPGISGTGKTRLTRLYADAIHGISAPSQPNPYYLIVAVQPDWHNARDLLGYYNALTNVYHPTAFLRFLLRAAADPQQLYFVCLDEMNLARPEYYLAPLLSALETAEHTIDLGVPADEAASVTDETIRNPLRLPLNVRMTGTINVDESTYNVSDKVLDRANVIELTDVDLPAFRAGYTGPVDEEIWQTITQVHAIVARAGQAFGYRTLGEMLHYIT